MSERLAPDAVNRGVFPDLRAGQRAPIDVRPAIEPFIDPQNPKHPAGIIRYAQFSFDQCDCGTALQVIPDGFYDTVTVCATRVQGDLTSIYPLYLSHDAPVIDETPETQKVGLVLPGTPFVADRFETDVRPVAAAMSGPDQAAYLRYDLPLCNRPLLTWAWDNGIPTPGTVTQPVKVVLCLMTLRH